MIKRWIKRAGIVLGLAVLLALGVGFSQYGNSPAQVERGAEVFARRCKPCHGDVGQGLTLWRQEWAPENQNCMFTKCHGLSHPPDGFYMPRDAPPLIGSSAITHFHDARHWQTAFDLYAYARVRMPLDVPGELSDPDYWATAAHILRENGKLPANLRLDDFSGPVLLIDPLATAVQLATNAVEGLVESPAILLGIIPVGAISIVIWKVRRSQRRTHPS
jgi:cytochrome c